MKGFKKFPISQCVFTGPLKDKRKVISSSKRPNLLLAGEMGSGVVEEVESGDSARQSGEVLETSSRRPKGLAW